MIRTIKKKKSIIFNKFYLYFLFLISLANYNILINSILLFLIILCLAILISFNQLLKSIYEGHIIRIKTLVCINISLSSILELFSWCIDFSNYKLQFQISNINLLYLYKSYLFFLYFNFILLLLSNLQWIVKAEIKLNNEIKKSINYFANKKNLFLFFFITIFTFISLYLNDFMGYRNLSLNLDLDSKKQLFHIFVKSLPLILGVIVFKNESYTNKSLALFAYMLVVLYFFNFGRREIFYSFLILCTPYFFLNDKKNLFQFIFKNLLSVVFAIFIIISIFYLFEINREDKLINSSLYSYNQLFDNLSLRSRKFFIYAELYSYEIKNYYPYHLLSNLIYSIPGVFIINKMNFMAQEEVMNKIFNTNYLDVNFYPELSAFNDFHVYGILVYPFIFILFWLILINLINYMINAHSYNSKHLCLILTLSFIFFYFFEYGESYNFLVQFRDIIIIFFIYYIITFFLPAILTKRTLEVK